MTLELSRQIFEKYSNFMKMCPAGAELFETADTTTLVVAFRNFAKSA
jgi:hypothetical protein